MPSTPPPSRPLRFGTRRSPLAMAQAQEARRRVCEAHGWTEEAIELVSVIASGDRIKDRSLADIGGKALWTRELDRCLAEGTIDAAVHSMKDVETIRPAELALGAVLPRADKADMLLGAGSIEELRQGATIGTSAPRRAAQLLHRRADCKVVTFRGNVATRMAKLAAGEVNATFLAAAGLDRLGEHGVGTRLAPEEWFPAPAQGAIGIECRVEDPQMRRLLAAIDHPASRREVLAERALLLGLGGSCHSPVAAVTLWEGEMLHLRAAIFSPDGAVRIEGETRFEGDSLDPALALARDLLDRAPPQVAATFAGLR